MCPGLPWHIASQLDSTESEAMRAKVAAAAVLILVAAAVAADKPKALYKVTRLSVSEVGISCLNGGDPAGKKIGDTVIMSCGKQ